MMNLQTFSTLLPLSPTKDPIIMGLLDGYELAAPESFWLAGPELIKELVNGCGPRGLGDRLVPDTVWFLCITAACKIHDWMFTVYNCQAGFELSNNVFLDNMNRINKAKTTNKILFWLREKRIGKYYLAVKFGGRIWYYDAHLELYDSNVVYA